MRLSLVLGLPAAAGLVLLPDLASALTGLNGNALADLASVPVALALAVAILLTRPRPVRWLLGILLVLIQGGWLATLAYFGEVPQPEQILISGNDTRDLIRTAFGEWRVLAPPLGFMLAYAAILAAADRALGRHGLPRFAVGGVAALVLLGGLVARPFLLDNAFAAALGRSTASAVAVPNAAGIALHMLVSRIAPIAGLLDGDAQVVPLGGPRPDRGEPVTVAVIMGESITPLRMSLYGGSGTGPDSPLIRRRADQTGPFRLTAKLGLSAGTGTLASVPTFLRVSYAPRAAAGRPLTLFRLAKAAGFRTYYVSAQHMRFGEIAGVTPDVDRIDDASRSAARIALRRDEFLLDRLEDFFAADPDGPRFAFVHQRVNHAPYRANCAEADQPPVPPGASGTDRRRLDYDIGLACYETNLDRLLAFFARRPGAVHVLVTADHSEFTGERGQFGHFIDDVYNVVVPAMLFTNRPDSDIARRFAALDWPTAYEIGALATRALGYEVRDPNYDPSRFFFNHTMPFGVAGHFQGRKIDATTLSVEQYAPDGRVLKTQHFNLATDVPR
ncbi:sulfatase-like hydrolase/transferase [Prosthecomicrobium hirschii]|uniref:sulfatase-like hydrolase/transferase n=1 Tax=Prosthecodimorpha hirschii TaxID=665126 RepID=UPI00128F6EAB|nr:sulfatase-like hydrolase/transferase [Prosthecomicrobium hirschii]